MRRRPAFRRPRCGGVGWPGLCGAGVATGGSGPVTAARFHGTAAGSGAPSLPPPPPLLGGVGVPWDGWLRCSVAAPEAAEFRGADWPGRAEDLTQFEFHDRPPAAWAAGFTEVI